MVERCTTVGDADTRHTSTARGIERTVLVVDDEVLEQIREHGPECRVVMVTAVNPDFDIVELPFDEYLHKPVTPDDIDEVIEEMREREEYTDGSA